MISVPRSLWVIVFTLGMVAASGAQTTTTAGAKAPPKSTSRVTAKYDKSKDTTLVTLKTMTISRNDQEKEYGKNFPLHQLELEAFFSYKGQVPTRPAEDVTLRFRCVSNTYIFLRGQEVIVAIDRLVKGKDRGFSLGISSYKSMSPRFNTVFEEVMDVKAPADALVKFSNAETLELFFGPLLYKLTEKQHDAIREFRSFLPETK